MKQSNKGKIIRWTTLLIIAILPILTVVYIFFSSTQKYKQQESESMVKTKIVDDSIIEIKEKETIQKKDQSSQNNLVCQYKTKKFEIITPPSKNDNIQKIIGYQNNKVGIYIYAEIDMFTDMAAKLVNSNGGDWGYVLIPYNVKDYNKDRWKRLFHKLSEKHLIPIVQLWDLDLVNKKETDKQIIESAKFLNSLDWPIRNRYVSVYNEVNDKKFWAGHIDPEQYAHILDKTIDALKKENENFFVMNGAFNASARTNWEYLDEKTYLSRMNKEVPGIFKKLDGWASHPYPQPNFTGSPKDTGRDSIRAYEWELEQLEQYGIDKNKMPVFITETGWPHKEGKRNNDMFLNKYQVADNIREAYEDVWLKDERVVAVTPFTIKYDPPHDNWSWITRNNNPYPQFTSVQDIKKIKGKPPVVKIYKSKVWICE